MALQHISELLTKYMTPEQEMRKGFDAVIWRFLKEKKAELEKRGLIATLDEAILDLEKGL